MKQENNYYIFDYLNICREDPDQSNKCKKFKRYCHEYQGDDKSICIQLEATDSNKRCVYNSQRTANKCYEEYKTCEIYNDNVSSKNRNACENLVLLEENQKCIYIREVDKCITSGIYKTCEEYTGTDKYTCELIKSINTDAYCILDADLKCKERNENFTCTEAYNEEDCLFYAKPIDSTKKCVFNSNKCYEVYKRCEDYIGKNQNECESLKLYNGKKCIFESDRCISKDKICKDATTKDECKLIAKIGVSDPDKKVCDFINYNDGYGLNCVENYKYCSDYRGTNQNICIKINPYDESGNYIDPTSKCEMDDYNQCQKISLGCSSANGNPIRCARISPKIKDNHIKHCVYVNGLCVEHTKKCEKITLNSLGSDSSLCTNNIPEDHLNYHCVTETKDSTTKCVSKKNCASFDEDYYANLCYRINPNCTYSNRKCWTTEVSCNNKIFFEVSDENEAICETLKVSSPNYVCILNEDKSGCKEILKNLTDSDSEYEPTNEENSSRFMSTGIQLIVFLLCLFI